MIQRLLDDVRHGTRILTKSPGLSLTAALLVALVVGGNATIYSMVNSQIRRPAPGVTAEDLVSFGLVGRPGAPYFSYAAVRMLSSGAARGAHRSGPGPEAGIVVNVGAPVR